MKVGQKLRLNLRRARKIYRYIIYIYIYLQHTKAYSYQVYLLMFGAKWMVFGSLNHRQEVQFARAPGGQVSDAVDFPYCMLEAQQFCWARPRFRTTFHLPLEATYATCA